MNLKIIPILIAIASSQNVYGDFCHLIDLLKSVNNLHIQHQNSGATCAHTCIINVLQLGGQATKGQAPSVIKTRDKVLKIAKRKFGRRDGLTYSQIHWLLQKFLKKKATIETFAPSKPGLELEGFTQKELTPSLSDLEFSRSQLMIFSVWIEQKGQWELHSVLGAKSRDGKLTIFDTREGFRVQEGVPVYNQDLARFEGRIVKGPMGDSAYLEKVSIPEYRYLIDGFTKITYKNIEF